MSQECLDAERLRALIAAHIPDAEIEVQAYAGNDHFTVTVIAPAFAGKSRLARHRMVYAALGDALPAGVHALALTTQTPAESGKEQA